MQKSHFGGFWGVPGRHMLKTLIFLWDYGFQASQDDPERSRTQENEKKRENHELAAEVVKFQGIS